MGLPGHAESGQRIRKRKIHGPSNGTCASEAALVLHMDINHLQGRKIKGAGMQVRLMRSNMLRGTSSLSSCRAGLVMSQGLLKPGPHTPASDPKDMQPVQSHRACYLEGPQAWLHAVLLLP